MKKIFIISVLILAFILPINAQDRRSGILEDKEQSIGIATGIDYSIMPLKLTYKRGINAFNYKFPVNIGADLTIPMFAFDLNDIRVRIITETTIYRKSNFEIRGGIDPVFINLKMQTERMSSLGADFHLFTGFTNDKWNTGVEINYNKILSTYIQHTDKYRENVFTDAVDGWYKNTASNIRVGILVNRTFNKFDVYLNAGLSKTAKFNNYLFVPTMYALTGVNYRF